MVFDYYSAFLPDVTVYENGYVRSSDLARTFHSADDQQHARQCSTCADGLNTINKRANADGFVDFYGEWDLYNC